MSSSPAPIGRERGYSPELAEAICVRVAAGESLRAICAEAAMPALATVRRWLAAHPAFAKARRAAQARRAHVTAYKARRQARLLARKRPWGRSDAYSAETGAQICRRLALGESLLSVCADEAMPVPGTVYEWLRAHDDFARAYTQAREVQAELLADHAWEAARTARAATVPVARLQFDVIRWRAAKLAPKTYGARAEWLAEQPDEGKQPLHVYVRRFSDGEILEGPTIYPGT